MINNGVGLILKQHSMLKIELNIHMAKVNNDSDIALLGRTLLCSYYKTYQIVRALLKTILNFCLNLNIDLTKNYFR